MTIQLCTELAKVAYPAIDDNYELVTHEDDRYIKAQYNEKDLRFELAIRAFKKTKIFNGDTLSVKSIIVYYFKEDDTYKFYCHTRKLVHRTDDVAKYMMQKEAICFKKHRSPSVFKNKGGFSFASIRCIYGNWHRGRSLDLNLRDLFIYFNPSSLFFMSQPIVSSAYIPARLVKKGLTVAEIEARLTKGYPSFESLKDKLEGWQYYRIIERYYKKDAVDFLSALAEMHLPFYEKRWSDHLYTPPYLYKKKEHIVSTNDGFTRIVEPSMYGGYIRIVPINDTSQVNVVPVVITEAIEEVDLPF